MSFAAIAWARDVDLGPRSGSRKALLLELADMMNQVDGRLNPKVSTMARKIGRSERCVQYGLRRLEAARLVTQLPQAGRRSCRYILHVGRVPISGQFAPQDGPELHPEVASFAPQAAANLHPEPREDSNQGNLSESVAPAARAREPLPVDEILATEGEGGGGMAEPIEPPIVVKVGPSPVAESVTIAVRAAGSAGKARRSGGKAPVSPDWEPDQADRLFALQRDLDPDETRLRFVLWHLANGRGVADPGSAYRLWCAREAGFQRPQTAAAARVEREAEFKRGLHDMAAQLRAAGFQGLPKGRPMDWGARP